MKKVSIITGLLLLFLLTTASKDEPKPFEYTPSETQLLRLQLKRKDLEFKSYVVQQAQFELERSKGDFGSECDKIKKENGWPKDLTCDYDGNFFPPPKSEPKGTDKK